MADYTATQAGDFNTDATWGGGGHPTSSGDTANCGAYAITAATAIVCGAITVPDGGSLNTGANAATITSITTSGNGAVTIGTGGCTFGTNVLNNAGTGTLTINGACTGVTVFTTGTCNMNANVACTQLVLAASVAFTMANGTQLTGITTNSTMANGSVWTVGSGCTISANSNATVAFTSAGTAQLIANGTAVSRTTFTNANAGTSAAIVLRSFSVLTLSYCDVFKVADLGVRFETAGSVARLIGCDIESKSAARIVIASGASVLYITNSWISTVGGGASTGLTWVGYAELTGVTFGVDRDGTTQANGTDINLTLACVVAADSLRLTASALTTGTVGKLIASNFGVANGAGTNAGGYVYGRSGWIERSTDAKKTGDFGAKLTPIAATATYPLELSIYLPVASGDDVSVSVHGLRSQLTDDCAEIEIDPEGAWYTPVVGTATMTNEDQFYEFTATRTGAGGTGATGMVRIVLRVKEYEASNYFYWADFTATIGGIDYIVDFSEWSQGIPVAKIDYYTPTQIAEAVWSNVNSPNRTLT